MRSLCRTHLMLDSPASRWRGYFTHLAELLFTGPYWVAFFCKSLQTFFQIL